MHQAQIPEIIHLLLKPALLCHKPCEAQDKKQYQYKRKPDQIVTDRLVEQEDPGNKYKKTQERINIDSPFKSLYFRFTFLLLCMIVLSDRFLQNLFLMV
jgi:hypothetical protein